MTKTSNQDCVLDWMLWRGEHQDPMKVVENATGYFYNKYGHWPNRIELPQAWAGTGIALQSKDGIFVEIKNSVLPGHIMVCYDPEQKTSKDNPLQQRITSTEAS